MWVGWGVQVRGEKKERKWNNCNSVINKIYYFKKTKTKKKIRITVFLDHKTYLGFRGGKQEKKF